MFRSVVCFLCLCAACFAQVKTPRLGVVRYPNATVHSVFGAPGAFVIGQPTANTVQAASFSESNGILSAGGQLRLLAADGSLIAQTQGAANAQVGIESAATTALAYLPSANKLTYFDGSAFHQVELQSALNGTLLSLRANGGNADLLVANNGGVSQVEVSLSSGNVLSENFLSGVKAPAAFVGSFIVFVDEQGLEVQGSNGTPQTLSAFTGGGNVSFERMSTNWLHISALPNGQQWALNVTSQQTQLFELPGPKQMRARPVTKRGSRL